MCPLVFCRLLANPVTHSFGSVPWIAEQAETDPVGVLRYDISAGCGGVSVYLVPGLAGARLGPASIVGRGTLASERAPRCYDLRGRGRIHERRLSDNVPVGGLSPAIATTFRKDIHAKC